MKYLLLCTLALGACKARETSRAEPAATTADTSTGWVLDASSFGRVKTGITLAEMNQLLGEHLVPAYQMSATCDHVDPTTFPDGVIVMIENDTVVRFDVQNPAIRTRAGAGVGDLESDVVSRYGSSLQVSPHKYTGPEGHYLTVTPPGDSLHLIIFETDGQRVTTMRAGLRPSVEYVEGCA